MSTPLVSIVISCHNDDGFLEEAIDSVGQPAHATEIVVVDYGSTGRTSETPPGDRRPNIDRLIRQKDECLAAARNRGLRESRGRYVIFLDAEDRLAHGAIDIGADALDTHPECFFVFGRCQMMPADDALLQTPVQPRIAEDHYRELLRRNYVWMTATVMFRRVAVELVGGFNRTVNASAGYDLCLRIARHHPVFDHAQVVAHYRQPRSNASVNAGRMLGETLAVLRSQRPFIEGDELSLAACHEGWHAWREFYGTQLVNEIRTHVRAGEWRPAIAKALTLARYHPLGFAHHLRHEVRIGLAVR